MSDELSLDSIRNKVIGYYRENAEKRFEYFEQAIDDHCNYSLKFITPAPASIADIGSGSGRDAAFFADKGYLVTAVEPAHELQLLAQTKHTQKNITWIEDQLPELFKLDKQFDHVHLSAVIFHLPEMETAAVLKRIHSLLYQHGTLFIGLRNGPSDPARPMFNVTKEWMASQSKNLFTVIDQQESPDSFNRSDVSWSRMILRKI